MSDEHDPLPRYLKSIMWSFQQAILLLMVLVGSDKVVKVSAQVTLLVACIVGPCYITARSYIIIKCFVSLRRLLVDAYTVPPLESSLAACTSCMYRIDENNCRCWRELSNALLLC